MKKLKININAKIITDNTDNTTENILISLYKLSPPCENYRNNNLPQLILNIEGKKIALRRIFTNRKANFILLNCKFFQLSVQHSNYSNQEHNQHILSIKVNAHYKYHR